MSGSKQQKLKVRSVKDQSGPAGSKSDGKSNDDLENLPAKISGAEFSVLIEKTIKTSLTNGDIKDNLVESMVTAITGAVIGVVKSYLSDRDARFAELEDKVEQLDTRNKVMFDDLQQFKRSNNLVCFGLNEDDQEATNQVSQNIVQLCTTKLNLVNIAEADIYCRRIGPKRREHCRPILVSFHNSKLRAEVIGARRLLKGTGLTIKEDLTRERQDTLRQAIAVFGQSNAWSNRGRIFWKDKEGRMYSGTKVSDVIDPGCNESVLIVND